MIQKRASLHEKTVQKVARSEIKLPRTRNTKKANPVTTLVVNPALIDYAKQTVADKSNGYTYWALLSTDEVVIR